VAVSTDLSTASTDLATAKADTATAVAAGATVYANGTVTQNAVNAIGTSLSAANVFIQADTSVVAHLSILNSALLSALNFATSTSLIPA
jgi:hypothetical protein